MSMMGAEWVAVDELVPLGQFLAGTGTLTAAECHELARAFGVEPPESLGGEGVPAEAALMVVLVDRSPG